MSRAEGGTVSGINGRARAERNNAHRDKDFRETEVQRFYKDDSRTRRARAELAGFSHPSCRSIRAHRKTSSADRRRRSFRRAFAGKRATASPVAAVYDRRNQGGRFSKSPRRLETAAPWARS